MLPVAVARGPVTAAPALSALDIATSLASGLDRSSRFDPAGDNRSAGHRQRVRRLLRADRTPTPRAALDAILRTALNRSPCLISFSGGRDSSALLAAATRLARIEGLAPPIPATLRFPGDVESSEDEWQELVVRHLGLDEWLTFTVHDELDAVGPVSTAMLRRHGLLWPFNTYMHQPIIAAAAGGSVITGFGGDELANSSRGARAAQVLTRRRRPNRTDPLVLGLAFSPRALRRRVLVRRARPVFEEQVWLTRLGRQLAIERSAADTLEIPISWASTLRDWYPRARYFRTCVDSLGAIASGYDVEMSHPFVDARMLSALAAEGGAGGLGGRTELMAHLFGDVLPEQTVRRTSKATFNGTLFTATAREFARSWSGSGVDRDLVDVARLRQHWLTEAIDARTLTMLQAAWLHDAG